SPRAMSWSRATVFGYPFCCGWRMAPSWAGHSMRSRWQRGWAEPIRPAGLLQELQQLVGPADAVEIAIAHRQQVDTEILECRPVDGVEATRLVMFGGGQQQAGRAGTLQQRRFDFGRE